MYEENSFAMLPNGGQRLPKSTPLLFEDEDHVSHLAGKTPLALKPASKRPSIFHSFRWEISCFFLATASFIALITVLYNCRDREIPDWKLAGVDITLNAIISILSTLFRSSLSFTIAQSISQLCWTWYTQPRSLGDLSYYDSASRGPWGCLSLLIKLRFRYFVSLGALLTIAAVGADTFFQQTLQYYSYPAVEAGMEARAAATHSYEPNNQLPTEVENSYAYLPYGMKAAALNGLLSSNLVTLPTPPFSCSTGNCTWDPFSTLAVNSQCIDVANDVNLNCTEGQLGCNLVSHDNSTLQSLLNGSTYSDTFYIEAGPPMVYMPVLDAYTNMTGILGVVQWVRALGVGPSDYEDGGINSTTSFEAGRCVFYLSVMEVKARVNDGVYTEETLTEYTDVQSRPPPTPLIENGNAFFFLDIYSFLVNYTLTFQPPFALNQPNTSNAFTMTDNTFGQISSLIWNSNFLNGRINVGFSGGAGGLALEEDTPNEDLLLLYEADNITRAMENLAQYITTEMRAAESENLEQYNTSMVAQDQAVLGKVWTQKQFVGVRWAWLALPAALLGLTLCLFIVVCLKTRKSAVGAWTSNPLTLLFHGRVLGGLGDFRLDTLKTAEEMNKFAEKVRVRVIEGV
ncbi:hypothetical protein N0V82_001954 [Gnomoniopsis sp. IMI 355080]|nr:hypothetical protein N0V82_001954 [Gnomoniopsis sp. IMI 355080]